MIVKRHKTIAGFTLIEVMISATIFVVAVLGTSAYRYTAALDARKADLQTSGARIALLLCESWGGVKGSETYDPTAYFASELTITTITGSAGVEYEDFTLLGGYTVALNGVNYYAILSWKDVSAELRALSVIVAWPEQGQELSYVADTYKLFRLTTYVSI